MKRKILLIFIIMTMIFIPSYKVEAKTLQELKNELVTLEKKYSDNQKFDCIKFSPQWQQLSTY